jgi:eukaryotic-like serine/threonine-protein kinase
MVCPTCKRVVPLEAEVCPWDGAVLDPTLPGVRAPPELQLPPALDELPHEPTSPGVFPEEARQGTEDTQKRDPIIGATLGEYLVGAPIGWGGMGSVYRALQPVIGKQVAIKVLRPEVASDPDQMRRLLDEARVVNAIQHRGIVDVFGFGKLPTGQDYMVMELLRGQPLDEVLRVKGSLSPFELVEVLEQVLGALAAAHKAGVIHRDLKPSNIFVVEEPSGDRYVKLLDFGLAKRRQVTDPGAQAQTRLSVVVGTPEYMAPEQARGEGVGPRADLYALGVIAFEALTGQLPFKGNSPMEVMFAHQEEVPPSPSLHAPGIPDELDRLVLQLLEKDPALRPSSAELARTAVGRVRRALAQASTRVAVTGERTVRPPPPVEVPAPPAADAGREARTRVAVAGAAVVLVVSTAVMVLGGGSRARGPAPLPDPNGPAPMVRPVSAEPAGTERGRERWMLQTRIDQLEGQLRAAAADGRPVNHAALLVLARLKDELALAAEPAQVNRVGEQLRAVEAELRSKP